MILLAAAPAFSFDGLVEGIFTEVQAFIAGDSGPFGMAVLAFLLAVHAIVGGAELASGRPSRLTSGAFWTRFILVITLLVGFDVIITGFTKLIVSGSVNAIADKTTGMWEIWADRTTLQYNEAIKMFEAQTSGLNLLTMGVSNLMEALISGMGMTLCLLIGGLCFLFCYFQAILGACLSAFMVALGPLCLPFAMHESTQDIAIGYLKSWLVYGVFYMPALVMAFGIAATVLSGLVNFSYGTAYTNNFDVFEHFLNMVVGPFAALAVVMAAPALLKGAIR